MPLSEARWQSALIKATQQDYGGWGIRMSALQRYGCPDLLLILPKFQPALIETKVTNVPDLAKGGSVAVAATPLQRETLRAIQQAGGFAGIWVLVSERLVLVTADPYAEYLKIGETEGLPKERGRAWPIAALLHRMGR